MLHSVPNDADFRELSEMMKGAWKTRQNRKKHGNPVSLQMPKGTLRQLKNLAKQNGQSQVETLSQIISNASYDQKLEKEKIKKERESFSIKLEEQQKNAKQAELVYKGVVERLLDALSEEISHRCCFEALMGELGSSSMDSEVKNEYRHSVEKRLAELESDLTELKTLQHYAGTSLRERMKAHAKQNGLVLFHEDDTYKGFL
jgi:vacuolar-type H+-ATPase subunit I/STV1